MRDFLRNPTRDEGPRNHFTSSKRMKALAAAFLVVTQPGTLIHARLQKIQVGLGLIAILDIRHHTVCNAGTYIANTARVNTAILLMTLKMHGLQNYLVARTLTPANAVKIIGEF